MRTTAYILLCILIASGAMADWPTYHGDYALTGSVPTRLPANPKRLWRHDMGSPVKAAPIIADQKIYALPEEGPLACFSFSGEQLWTTEFGTNTTFKAPPIYARNKVVAGSEQGVLYAVDSRTGKVKWEYRVGENIEGSPNWAPDAKGGAVLVIGQTSGSIHALDIATGNLRWKVRETNRCDGSPAVANSRLVFGNCDAAIYGYSTASGAKENETALGSRGQVAGGVAASDGIAFAGTHGKTLFALNIEEGEILWDFEDADGPVYTTPAVDGKYVVFASERGTVYCLDRKTGILEWKVATPGPPSSPAIAADKVVISSFGKLYLLDLASGKILWSYEISDDATSPAVANGIIAVGGDDGAIWVFGSS